MCAAHSVLAYNIADAYIETVKTFCPDIKQEALIRNVYLPTLSSTIDCNEKFFKYYQYYQSLVQQCDVVVVDNDVCANTFLCLVHDTEKSNSTVADCVRDDMMFQYIVSGYDEQLFDAQTSITFINETFSAVTVFFVIATLGLVLYMCCCINSKNGYRKTHRQIQDELERHAVYQSEPLASEDETPMRSAGKRFVDIELNPRQERD